MHRKTLLGKVILTITFCAHFTKRWALPRLMLVTTPFATECPVLRRLCIPVLYILLPLEGYSTSFCTVTHYSTIAWFWAHSLALEIFTASSSLVQFLSKDVLWPFCHIFQRQSDHVSWTTSNPKNYMSVPSISDLWESYQMSHVAAVYVDETHTSHKFSFSSENNEHHISLSLPPVSCHRQVDQTRTYWTFQSHLDLLLLAVMLSSVRLVYSPTQSPRCTARMAV